jgi:DNA-binding LytR/AlgR family response regulator
LPRTVQVANFRPATKRCLAIRRSSGRSHRSTIVNVNTIAGVSRELSGGFVVKLKNRDETLPVSQQFAHRFRQM